MKNQYIGDAGDYGKYGLLRFLLSSGIDTGVNWYLTPDDGRNDGNHTEYLYDERMRTYDHEVYDTMKRIAPLQDRNISMTEQSGILPGARFYNTVMDFSSTSWLERAKARMKWHKDAMKALQDVELIFADPDNGLSIRQRPTKKEAQKYILPLEIMDYYRRDQQVMYYHHRSRKNEEGWLEDKRQIKAFLPDAKLLAVSFHRWSARTYIFVLHENRYARYKQILNDFMRTKWGTHTVNGKVPFTFERI